jgi:hypothetical protein
MPDSPGSAAVTETGEISKAEHHRILVILGALMLGMFFFILILGAWGVIRRHRGEDRLVLAQVNAAGVSITDWEQFWKDGRHDIACPPRGVLPARALRRRAP